MRHRSMRSARGMRRENMPNPDAPRTPAALRPNNTIVRNVPTHSIRSPANVISYLGLSRLLPDRLSRLSSGSQEQPVDEHLVSHRLVHLLRLVEPVVPAPPLRHLGHRLLDGPPHGTQAEHAQA